MMSDSNGSAPSSAGGCDDVTENNRIRHRLTSSLPETDVVGAPASLGSSACCQPAKSRYMNSRAKPNHAYVPTDVEHLANVITHGLWIGPSIIGLWWMTSISTSPLQHISAIIYGLSLFCLFTVSTTFHTLAYFGRFRSMQRFFHIGDRAVIYIFIASSYTPWLTLKEFHRWSLLTLFIVWVAALLGIYYQYTFHEQYKWFETVLYMVVGMAPSIIILEMKESSGLLELAIGGALYVVGVVFFKCDGVIPFAHAIWHSFVFVGAAFHFVAVCRHLLVPSLPAAAVNDGLMTSS